VVVADDEEEPPRTLGLVFVPVSWGLSCHSARLELYLVSIFALIVVLILTVAQAVREEVLPFTIDAVLICILFVQPGLGIAGSLLCLGAPAESKSRRFILASLVMDLTTAAVGAALILNQQTSVYAAVPPIFAWVCFVLFLRGLALYFDQLDQAHDALVLVLEGIGLTVLGALLRLGWIFYWFEVRPELVPDAVLILDGTLYLVTITGLVFFILLILNNLEFIGTICGLIRPKK
jgi:hypothetical protein